MIDVSDSWALSMWKYVYVHVIASCLQYIVINDSYCSIRRMWCGNIITWLTERITSECCNLIGYIHVTEPMVFSRLFAWLEWTLLMGDVIVTKMALDFATCSCSLHAKPMDTTESGPARECFRVLLSLAAAWLHVTVWPRFDTTVSTPNNTHSIALLM